MKKLIALMLLVSMLAVPALSLAQQVDTYHYELDDIGVSMDAPIGWYTATTANAGNCSLAAAYQMTGAEIRAMLNEMGAGFYAVCDDYGITHLVVLCVPGMAGVDMRKDNLKMDSFMKGFLTNYSDVSDSGVYKTDASTYAYVHFKQPDGAGGTIDTAQFVTNFDGKLYIVQMMSYLGVELNDISIGLGKQVVDSIEYK
ncbi:MAG: hypothetical protein IJD39_11790 [Clostridia bacterium]|nr:hypothetical protein [Clostridia bacterium]